MQDGKIYNAGRIDRNKICESDGERSLSINLLIFLIFFTVFNVLTIFNFFHERFFTSMVYI